MQPLGIDLFYMVTPYSDDKSNEKSILGKVMQIFHDNPVLEGPLLQGSFGESDKFYGLELWPINLGDIARVWAAQDVAYRLSVVYKLSGVEIDLMEMGQSYNLPSG